MVHELIEKVILSGTICILWYNVGIIEISSINISLDCVCVCACLCLCVGECVSAFYEILHKICANLCLLCAHNQICNLQIPTGIILDIIYIISFMVLAEISGEGK